MDLPQRVWILGPPGSGKSAVADQLAALLGIAATHLDDLHWQPGWVEVPDDVFASRVAQIAGGDSWVIDGNYSRVRKVHADRVQLFVWLDLPLRITLPRLMKRTWRRCLRRQPCCNGNYESLWRTMSPANSILWWALTSDRRRRAQWSTGLQSRLHVRLQSQSAIHEWLTGVFGSRRPHHTTAP